MNKLYLSMPIESENGCASKAKYSTGPVEVLGGNPNAFSLPDHFYLDFMRFFGKMVKYKVENKSPEFPTGIPGSAIAAICADKILIKDIFAFCNHILPSHIATPVCSPP